MEAYFTTEHRLLVKVANDVMEGNPSYPMIIVNPPFRSGSLNGPGIMTCQVRCQNVQALMEFIGQVAAHGDDGLIEVR